MITKEEAATLRAFVTDPVIQKVFAQLEADAFDTFMALPRHERHDKEGEKLIAHIDALRDVRDRLTWLASTATARGPSGVA